MNKLKRTLDDIHDKCYIYSIMLNQAERFYNKLKLSFKIPIIVISSVMSIVNSSFGEEDNNTLKIVNISFNIVTALTLSLGATLQLEMKEQDFSTSKKKFMKLSSLIEQKLINDEEDITSDFVTSVINQYDNIQDGIDFEIPNFICQRVRNEYAGKKTLPVIINGIKKEEHHRSNSCLLEEVNLESNLVYDEKKNIIPRVLDVKFKNNGEQK